jgi:hypothetical protein
MKKSDFRSVSNISHKEISTKNFLNRNIKVDKQKVLFSVDVHETVFFYRHSHSDECHFAPIHSAKCYSTEYNSSESHSKCHSAYCCSAKNSYAA